MEKAKFFYTSIAGINFRCTPDDLGSIIGYVQQDKENEYNPKAVGVYRINGSLLGYVSEKDLDSFYEFKGEGYDKMVFYGNIKSIRRLGKEFYVGNISIVRSENEEELTSIINNNFLNDFNLYGKTTILSSEDLEKQLSDSVNKIFK